MFTKVIWATDGSTHADRAMMPAVELAKADQAELHVVHIVEKLFSGRASGMDAFANEDQVKAKVKAQAKAIGDDTDLNPTVHITVGMADRIGNRIADIADEIGADLIVVGTRGHGAVGSLVLGSVTQRLLHVAHCPILAVPPQVTLETEETPEPAATAS